MILKFETLNPHALKPTYGLMWDAYLDEWENVVFKHRLVMANNQ